MDRHYKIQELVTTGWEDIAEEWNVRLTKEQCDLKIEQLMKDGISPARLNVRRVK